MPVASTRNPLRAGERLNFFLVSPAHAGEDQMEDKQLLELKEQRAASPTTICSTWDICKC